MPKEATDEERPPKDTKAEGGTTDRRARRETERAFLLASGARNFADYLTTPNVPKCHKEDNAPHQKKTTRGSFLTQAKRSEAERSGAERSGAERSEAERFGLQKKNRSKSTEIEQLYNNSIITLLHHKIHNIFKFYIHTTK